MCGDGANDCGALKTADAGVSLSETEASIAAPFSSKVQDISCIPTILREGRACLSMTIQAFKFIELYAIIETISVCILYRMGVNLSDNQYLYIDMVVLFPLSIFSSWTAASSVLTKDLPAHSLLKPSILLSIIGQAFIQLIFMVFIFSQVSSFESKYFTPCKANKWEVTESGEELITD